MAIHKLKTWPQPFQAQWEGRKLFEFRRDDHDPPFSVDDVLHSMEWNPETETFSGRMVAATVAYVARGLFGIPDGYCVMSLADLKRFPPLDSPPRES